MDGADGNRCCERYSRTMVHEARSLETCGMCCAHVLFASDNLVVEELGNKYDPTRSWSWWPSGIGCTSSNPNRPGHVLKLLSGRGTHGANSYVRGLKMMESCFLARLCHPPISSYLQGSSDIEIRRIR